MINKKKILWAHFWVVMGLMGLSLSLKTQQPDRFSPIFSAQATYFQLQKLPKILDI